MYVIVETHDGDGNKEVSAVPKTWLINDKMMLWPPERTKNVSKKIMKLEDPGENWQTFKCVLLFKDLSKSKQFSFYKYFKFYLIQF